MADVLLGENMNRGRKAFDKLLELRDVDAGAITSTASTTGLRFPIRKYKGLCVMVHVTAIDATSNDETYVLTVEVSDTVNGTYTPIAALPNIRDAGTGIYTIPISGETAQQLDDDSAFVRVTATLGGTTPSLTYGAYIAQAV